MDSLDGSDTYDPQTRAVKHFSEGSSLTIQTDDSPGEALEGSRVEGLNYPFNPPPGLNDNHQDDALKVDDYFEMYMVYFTTTSPSIERTIGKLPWNWGGIVVYDARVNQVPYRETTTVTGAVPRTGFASNQSITYQGYTGDPNFVMGTCPGSSPPVPSSVDSARFFTRQLYYDILNRQPDGAWLVWVSFITNCGFDQACINSTRISNTRGFFESAEFRSTHSGFDNPGSNEYNSNYVQQLYWTLLQRPPDGSWTAWLDYINQTGDYNGLVGGFINSAEYRNRLNSLWP